MDRQSQKAIDAGRAAHERLRASSDPIISAHAKATGYLADDYPGPDGETLRRQRLPGAAERWEALPWESRMALLGGLAEEAAQHRREADFAASTAMQERYAALATTWETAHAVLMRADTVSSKDKSQEEVAAERAKYAAPVDDKAAIVAFLRAEETKYRMALHETTRREVAERHTARASILATMAAYIERGDYLTGDVK
jgi:hypothetical protein